VTLSETRSELRAVGASHGWNLDDMPIHELSAVEGSGVKPDDQYTFFHPSEVELAETTKAVFDEVDKVKPSRVVFDSLSEMRLLAREPLRYRRQILGLKQFFVDRDCTVLLLDDRTSQEGDLQLSSLAHGVIALEQLAPEYGAERRRLRVVKLRGVRFLGGFHDFVIETGGLRVFPRLVAAESRTGARHESASSGIAELDALCGGGLDRGTSTLFMGPAGAGKSALATQHAVAAADRGERVAMYLFDEGLETFHRRAAGLGADTERHVATGHLTLTLIDPAEMSPGEFSDRIRTAVDSHHASVVADTVVLLRFFEAAGEVRQAISVIKKRSGRHERAIRELRLAPGGISLGLPLTDFRGVLSGVPVPSGGTASATPD
jgi:circadian clock protein KaiC